MTEPQQALAQRFTYGRQNLAMPSVAGYDEVTATRTARYLREEQLAATVRDRNPAERNRSMVIITGV